MAVPTDRAAVTAAGVGVGSRPWRQTLVITVVAVAAFAGIRMLPISSSNLHYQDFHAGGKSFLEFCEPGSPQFAPVDRVRSPVVLEVVPEHSPRAGESVACRARLETTTGKVITPDDLLVVHTEKFHLLVVDASLEDYQHVHPIAGEEPGEFVFSFQPRRTGTYRLFADFTPRATGRALYASARLEVAGVEPVPANQRPATGSSVVVDGIEFALSAGAHPVRIFEATDLTLRIRRTDGAPVALEEIMGAAAHMVAFDAACSGFAHLHPVLPEDRTFDQPNREWVGAAVDEARLQFALQVSDPGDYRLWAQVKISGSEIFAPFDLRVAP